MKQESYTPGHSDRSRQFMARRSADKHADFFMPFLREGMKLLDCGCGPGTISRDFAGRLPFGWVTGIDTSSVQVEEARSKHKAYANLEFRTASVYDLPFEDATIDAVFSHALFEHLADPLAALKEILRVLKPGGRLGLCSPDFAAFVLSPSSEALEGALSYYRQLQESNGGDTLAGRRLLNWLQGFSVKILASGGRCENYEDPGTIGEYLAEQLDAHDRGHASAFRDWQVQSGALFAQMWIHVVAEKTP